MEKVFLDTGAFIALFVETDRYHRDAAGRYDTLVDRGARFIATNHVVDETCTWILRHAREGHRSALRFGMTIAQAPVLSDCEELPRQVSGPPGLSLIYSTPDVERRAWDIFARYDTAGFTFTDCVSFAVMQMLGIKKAFTYDAHFELMGFERV